ncbi:MAG: UDP-4-amino-4,6-dideoxy-N-acetyl-beta-L-altrosamine transaminase [Candidatus Woesearchaeota archaeon]
MRKEFLPYGLHDISDDDIRAVTDSLKGSWITTGPTIAAFEKAVAEYVGAKYAVAVNSGTAALDIAVAALGLKPGDEAITTPLTFAATSNALVYNGIRPVFADIDPKTLNINPADVRKKITPRTKLIIYVDYSGQPCKIDELKAIAEEHKLFLIEDAAHAIGATYKGRRVGAFADMTIFSFHPVKHITTGEGGMVVTNNEKMFKSLLLLRNHGIDKDATARYGPNAGWAYDMKVLGRNYRITDFQCALGISQLKRLDEFIAKRKKLVALYKRLLPPEIQPIEELPECSSAWHIFPVLLPKGIDRDAVFQKMRKANIGVNVHYIPVYRHSYYQQNYPANPNDYPVTEDAFSRMITLPLFSKMTEEDVRNVVEELRTAVQ